MKNLLHSLAQDKITRELRQKVEKKKKKEKEFPGDKPSVTYHTIDLCGKQIRYKATAGYLKMKDDHQKIKTRMFYIAYEKEGEEKNTRPITFAFNGGPGASSAWVHFGCMGPKRVKMTYDGKTLPPPAKIEDNDLSWLDFTDLVFIDPVGTGYSRIEKGEELKEFCGVQEDVKWVSEFIRLYASQNKRWISPKYIAGESYGTFRAAGLAAYMQSKHGMDFNGIVFISSAVSYQTFHFTPGNDLPYILFFPAYAATAWYHKKLPENLGKLSIEDFLKEVEAWTISEYSVALLKGDSLAKDEREKVIKKMSEYTGLPYEYIDKSNLRVEGTRFLKQILGDKNKIVGSYDSRLVADDVDPTGEKYAADPSMFNLFGSHIAALNYYVRNDLKYENDLTYNPINRDVSKAWVWAADPAWRMGYPNVSESLQEAISYNKFLSVFVACGYYDLVTPYFLAKYSMGHIGLAPELRDNIQMGYYEGGHMMYVHYPSRKKLFDEVKAFYKKCLSC